MEEECIEIDNDTMCGVCFAEFLDTDDLKLHVVQYHLNETNIKRFCKFCSIFLSDINAFVYHLRNEHLTNIKSCRYCLRVFNDIGSLFTHEKKHKSLRHNPKISCSKCSKLFVEKIDLENHEFKDHTNDRSEGMLLQYCFPELSASMRMNIRTFLIETQENVYNFKCSCPFNTTDIKEHIKHVNTTRCRKYVCDMCSKTYIRRETLEHHMKTHYLSKNIPKTKQCPKCNSILPYQKINTHIKKCRAMKCLTCGVTFDALDKYAAHVTTHLNQVNCFTCKYCRRSVVGNDVLKKHIEKVHKPFFHLYKYYCLPCDKVFKHPKLLFAHFFSAHKKLEPYKCNICDEKFRIRKNFTLHIKLEHKSVGFVEFDSNYHVFFTKEKSENPFEPKNLEMDEYIENCEEGTESIEGENDNEKTDESKEIDLAETNDEKNIKVEEELSKVKDNTTDNLYDQLNNSNKDKSLNEDLNSNKEKVGPVEYDYLKQRTSKRKLKQISKPVKKSKTITLVESSDSDTPLSKLSNTEVKLKRKKYMKKTQVRKFICKTCDRNCYTFQNYHRHMSLHEKNKPKICVKCFAKFRTKDALNKHMNVKHSRSELTETLKKLLDKRKSNVTTDLDPLQTNLFMKTIHRVPMEKYNTQATIIVVENDQSPVKKFLENFQPETAECNVNNVVKVKMRQVVGDETKPLIKMKKFTPERVIPESVKPNGVQLQMPIKFKDEVYEKPRVSVKLVRCEYITSSINLKKIGAIESEDEKTRETYTIIDETSLDEEYEFKSDIPEASQEIELEGSEYNRPNVVQRSIVLDNMLPTNKMRIGHLSNQAPYFKIIKVDDVLARSQPEQQSSDITLPNGMKLVSVNPLAHLLNKSNVDINKKRYYKPKVQNVSQAIVKAMKSLDSVPVRSKSKKKFC